MTNIALPSTSQKQGKHIFVTVGTTRFDKLVSSATSKVALAWMERQGFSSLTIQYGKGAQPEVDPNELCRSSLNIQSYDFRPSLKTDMENADLILSHAGAGTVMEVLRMHKKLIVVINTQLMDNHQTELAGAMADRGHLCMVEFPEKLDERQTWTSFEDFSPVPHQEGDAYDMPRLLDSFLGFTSSKVE
jgi:beta-1,4-N-acetylglucosaminyltransferase